MTEDNQEEIPEESVSMSFWENIKHFLEHLPEFTDLSDGDSSDPEYFD